MALTYERYIPHRPLTQYVGQAGLELGGLALSPDALQVMGDAKTSGIPCELTVIGAWVRDDGMRWLDFAATTDYIEAMTDLRYDREHKRLRLVCPDCGMKDGKHTKGCDR